MYRALLCSSLLCSDVLCSDLHVNFDRVLETNAGEYEDPLLSHGTKEIVFELLSPDADEILGVSEEDQVERGTFISAAGAMAGESARMAGRATGLRDCRCLVSSRLVLSPLVSYFVSS